MSEAFELFSDAWAREWCRLLGESDEYREAGARWDGAVGLVVDADASRGVPEARAVRLALSAGDCHGAAAVPDGDLDGTPTVIGAAPEVWRRVLAGDLDPLFAIMGGRLQLRSGSLSALLPHARAAKELVATARRVPTRFPDGWESP